MSERRALAKGLVFVGAATMVGNGAAYLVSMIAARVFHPADFGAFSAMLNILVIVSTLAVALQALAARRVSVAAVAERGDVEGQAVRLSVFVGVGIIVVGALASWPLSSLLAIPYFALTLGLSSLGFVVFGSAAMGIAQGREEHTKLSIGFISNGVGRAIGGIVALLLIGTLVGASAGLVVGCAVGAVIAYSVIARGAWSSRIERGWAPEYAHIAHALIVLFTLTSIDMILARVFLDADHSGEYGVGVQLAKIAFFMPNAIVIVLFPKMAAGGSRRAVLIATGLTATLGALITTFSWLFGDLVVRVLGGTKYPDLGSDAWLFALEGSAFALVQVILYGRLAAQDRRAVAAVWAALVALVAVVALWRHESVVQIVTTVVFVSLALAVFGLLIDRRQATNTTPVPLEVAE